jgi:two-component system, cell cycle sensor histidine kinase and response regulator CckA
MTADLGSMEVTTFLAHADLATALREAGDAVVVVTNDFTADGPVIAFVNKGFLELTGYGPGELEGKPFGRLLESLGGRDPLVALRENHLDEARWQATALLHQVNQSTVPIELDASPLVDSSGRVSHFTVVARDTAKLHSATRLLQDLESTLDTVQSVVSVGTWVGESGSKPILRLSPQMLRIFELTARELEENPGAFSSRVHPEDRVRVWRSIREGVLKHKGFDIQLRTVLPSGKLRWIHARGTVVNGAEGTPLRLVGVACDITDGVVTRKSLSIAEQRYAAAAEASQDGLMLLCAERNAAGEVTDLKIIDLNHRASELLCMDREELLGQELCGLLPQLRDLGYFARFVHVLETGAPYRESIQGQSLGISTAWIRLQVVALGDGVAISICDVSHERALTSQLAKARRLESVGSLAVGIAHDFNNMLSAILGFGGLALGSQPDGSKARADIEQVIKAAERATQLTRYLLAFSSRQELEPKAVDASRAIVDLAPILSRLAGPAIELAMDLRSAQVICVDPCRFEQAVVNLVANARDAMPNGGSLTIGSRSVTLQREDIDWTDSISPGQYLCISVTDDGSGMDEATRARIFEPFFTTKPPGRGTGLGLASVYGFVRQSNGHICVDSEVGRGTVIRLYFPQAHAAMRRSSAPPPRLSGTVARHEGRVLVVERDDLVRTVAGRILSEQGYNVLEASDAWAAENILKQRPVGIDVLLAAVGLPHMTGIELARRVKLTHREIAVVLMSGAADMSDIENASESLNAVFVQKPFTAAALLDRVRDALHMSLLGPAEVDRCDER